jgi:hypothetical protein
MRVFRLHTLITKLCFYFYNAQFQPHVSWEVTCPLHHMVDKTVLKTTMGKFLFILKCQPRALVNHNGQPLTVIGGVCWTVQTSLVPWGRLVISFWKCSSVCLIEVTKFSCSGRVNLVAHWERWWGPSPLVIYMCTVFLLMHPLQGWISNFVSFWVHFSFLLLILFWEFPTCFHCA